MQNINLGAHFLFLLILCSIKIERLLFLKFLKNLAFFDSYFWPFNESEEKIKVIFVISAIMPSIWNVFIKFHWHDKKITSGPNNSVVLNKRGGWTIYPKWIKVWSEINMWSDFSITYWKKFCTKTKDYFLNAKK